MNIVIMGPQGSGKTTQADLLAKFLKVPHISTGEIYREIAEEDSPLGIKIKNLLDKGELIDDETTYEVVDKNLGKIKNGFVVDGFPRTLAQAERDPFIVDLVMLINLSDELCVKRLLSRAREDDTQDLITQRLKLFHDETEPVIEYYRKLGKLMEIDGSGSVMEVHNKILEGLDSFKNKIND